MHDHVNVHVDVHVIVDVVVIGFFRTARVTYCRPLGLSPFSFAATASTVVMEIASFRGLTPMIV